VRFVRKTTLFVRKSTLFIGKCLELCRTLRIHVISCRERTFNVSFLRFLLGSDLWCGMTFRAERRVQKEDRARVLPLVCLWEVVVKKAENDVVVFFRYSHRWVSHSWRWIVTIRICRVCKQVLELPKACRLFKLIFIYTCPNSSDSFSSFRWTCWHPGFRRVDGKGSFLPFSA